MQTYDNIKHKDNNKKNKKVSKYRDKNGYIAREMIECIDWIKNMDLCYIEKICTDLRKLGKVTYKYYRDSKLRSVFDKNRYVLSKSKKIDGYAIYSKKDVYEFLLILLTSIDQDKLEIFLDIPDVFYITRQIKGIGLEYYGLN